MTNDEEIGVGTTTLDYLKVRYQWLGELINETAAALKAKDAEIERLRAENHRVMAVNDKFARRWEKIADRPKGVKELAEKLATLESARAVEHEDIFRKLTAEVERLRAATKEYAGEVCALDSQNTKLRARDVLVNEVVRLTKDSYATIGMVMGAARRLAEWKP